MSKGLLIVLSGPSGVGKGTIYARLLKELSNLSVSISATTRKPRAGEEHGVHYYFVSREEFIAMRDEGKFLEWAVTVGNCYGTPSAPVFEKLNNGIDVLLEIDVKGAKQVKEAYPDCKTIFVLPPSKEELAKRLMGRGTETKEQVKARLELANSELMESEIFDYRVVNDNIDVAVNEVIDIIKQNKGE
ncbi:MAG: guanylate kinase [Clostridia bacterium]|nr:guanylate kinase [Clostridia bacterium]